MARQRVHGPYANRGRWRVITVDETGIRGSETFDSKEEADDFVRDYSKSIADSEGVSLATALDQYEVWMRQKGNKPKSVQTTIGRIKRLFADDIVSSLPRMTESKCARLYEQLQQAKVSVDYHRNALNETRTFFKWCISKPRQWIRRNPLADIAGEGKRRKGKPQLRVDEARRFAETCSRMFAEGDIAGAVGLAALSLGTRITELVARPVRDLDDDGWLLWIPDSKTEAGRRKLEVPADLRSILLQLATGKEPHEPLFRGARSGEHITRNTAFVMVKRCCREAGVPPVSPHGLRGTHASIARDSGVTPNVVAAAIGHTNYDAVTARNYVAPGTDERVRARAVMQVLQGGRR